MDDAEEGEEDEEDVNGGSDPRLLCDGPVSRVARASVSLLDGHIAADAGDDAVDADVVVPQQDAQDGEHQGAPRREDDAADGAF